MEVRAARKALGVIPAFKVCVCVRVCVCVCACVCVCVCVCMRGLDTRHATRARQYTRPRACSRGCVRRRTPLATQTPQPPHPTTPLPALNHPSTTCQPPCSAWTRARRSSRPTRRTCTPPTTATPSATPPPDARCAWRLWRLCVCACACACACAVVSVSVCAHCSAPLTPPPLTHPCEGAHSGWRAQPHRPGEMCDVRCVRGALGRGRGRAGGARREPCSCHVCSCGSESSKHSSSGSSSSSRSSGGESWGLGSIGTRGKLGGGQAAAADTGRRFRGRAQRGGCVWHAGTQGVPCRAPHLSSAPPQGIEFDYCCCHASFSLRWVRAAAAHGPYSTTHNADM
jgi:hypothetical protein